MIGSSLSAIHAPSSCSVKSILRICALAGISLFSFESRAVFDEPENDQGLLRTKLRDLRGGVSIVYQEGAFPFHQNFSTGFSHTPFCTYVPGEYQPQSVLSSVGSPSLNVHLTPEGYCQIAVPGSNSPETVLGRINPGQDGRERIQNTTDLPYRLHGHLITRFPNGNEYVGSGTLIGPHHVLTAGHCLYHHKVGEGWPTNVTFIPGRNEYNTPFGQVSGALVLSVENWVRDQNPGYDFGMVILDRPIGYQTGWAALSTTPENLVRNYPIHVTGYPGEKGPDNLQSTQMWTMSHGVRNISTEQIEYDIDTSPGQSGSGIWAQWPDHAGYGVIGVHAYGITPGRLEGNKATRVTPAKFRRLVRWMQLYQLPNLIHPGQQTELKLAGGLIGGGGIEFLVPYLPFPNTLRKLGLEHHKLGHYVNLLTAYPNLTELNLDNNNLGNTGVYILSGLVNLTSLNLQNNQIGDEGAQELRQMTRLQELSLYVNQVGNVGAQHLSGLTNLTSLNLQNNQIGDEGVRALSALLNLRELHLGQNLISSRSSQYLNRLTNLTTLTLPFYKNDGYEIVRGLNGLSGLTRLSLWGSHIGSAGAEHLRRFTSLTALDLHDSRIGDAGVYAIRTLVNLRNLSLQDNQIGDTALYLTTLRNLTFLNLGGNQIGPQAIQALRQTFHNCQFHCDRQN